ncbi:MAG: helix-turn-helix transcriptional regulator [Bosea sp. (in: a-proteobacteria)]|uniref:helix-turn-helix domain-containing protein n=1 Tax=Bosea sp. (in: a-proteobacteria) TaxID=1871050 RepID=UPI0027357ED5|nr:helix-turn-helix transcriptional regulator [Bosea sp. (in: a-proteobacteria)]MDP3255639.1 helix-turn-helix transcriptional regulator [Bosea sp. (in: a-proteobacteria)]MDP3319242.1 helix-turn-helix transcriptional regulator [Bosea sp. (in: a-proteobacteria)]
MTSHRSAAIGPLIRDWRQQRRLSQLDLALEAEISQKHLSFVESGRSQPSRDMVLLLAEHLGVPLRERNALLLAAGYAPVYLERALEDPALQAARAAVDLVLTGHEPYPALAVDRHWTLLATNAAVAPLLALVGDADLLRPPVNVLRLALHPGGLAGATVNLGEWRAHLLARLRQQVRIAADPALADLLAELLTYPAPPTAAADHALPADGAAIAVPLRLRVGEAVLSFISTTTVFGTPVDITLSELALETFFPADDMTAAALRALAEARRDASC